MAFWKKNKKTKEKEEVVEKPPEPEFFYENVKFSRDEEELEFYKTPLFKKEHLLTILGVGFFLLLLCTASVINLFATTDRIKPVIISDSIEGMGIYDPSVTYDKNNKTAWMAYSSIRKRSDGQAPNININIAKSFDQGKQWRFFQTVLNGKKDLLSGSRGQILDETGVWRYETPSLVYDPDDPEQAWKLYAYKYFWTGNASSAKKYSVITYKSSKNIATEKWSDEDWLFSSRSGQPPEPYGSLILLHLNNLHPSLRNILYYTEPSVIYHKGALLMTLTAYKQENSPDSIILIGSKDHGRSWLFLGTLITSSQASHYGDYTRVDSSSLVENKGNLYLMVSLGDKNIQHQGTHIFSVSNFPKGQLKKDKSNFPEVINYIDTPAPEKLTKLGAGQSTYNENLVTGILMPQMIAGEKETPFQIYATKKPLLKE